MTINFFRQITVAALCFCNPFRLQMYWEEGYMWQEVDYEFQEFCMTRNYNGYPGHGKCYYGAYLTGPCRDDAVYVAECETGNMDQQWTFVNLRNDEFMIKAVTGTQCFERINTRDIRLRKCDSGNSRQRWYTPGGKNNDKSFAISQGVSNLCIGQLHHPKDGEVVEMESCRTSYRSDTLFWERD